MTNEEAIEWIKGLKDSWDDTTNVTACNMAIQALKSNIHIPSDATNGDVIKAMFPNIQRYGTVVLTSNERILFTNLNIRWWNAQYREGDANEISNRGDDRDTN